MGFLDIFVEREKKPSKDASPKKEVPSKIMTPITVGNYTPSNVVVGMDPNLLQQFRDQFAKILADENTRNFPGNDYYEFVVMKNAMSAIPQEDIKYQAAYAGWKTGGNQTKDFLISTANKYLGLVDREIKEFTAAYEQQHAQTVGKNESAITQKTAEVQQLVARINQLNAEIQTLKDENSTQSTTLVAKHKAFMQAGELQREEILDEINKINKYIQ